MTISANISDTYTNESGIKRPVTIEAILHDIRTKFTNHVSRSDRENTLNIYHDTIKYISEILEANNLEVSENIKKFLDENSNNKNIVFYSDEMNQTQNMSYNSNIEQNKEKSEEIKELLIDSFNSMIEAIKCDYKANSYRNRRMPNNFQNFAQIGVIYFGANEEMRSLRDEKFKDLKGLTEEEAEFFNSLDDEEVLKRSAKFLKKLEEKFGVKILYQTLHNDEKTKHVQFMFSSYNFDNHRVFKSNLKKFDLKILGVELQDMIAKEFEDMQIAKYKGHQFKINRGKHNTKSIENLSMSQMQQEKIKGQEKIIDIQEQSIEENETKIKETYHEKNELENIIDNIRSEKSEVDLDLKNSKVYRDEIKNDLTLSKEQKKSLYDEISEVQKSLRTKRKELVNVEKEIKSIKDLDTSLKKDTLEILKNSKTILGFDENKLKKSIYQKIKQYSKIELKAKEIDDLKQDKATLIEHNTKLIEEVEKRDERLLDKDEIITDKAHEIKRLMQRDKNNANFTKQEIVEATLNYENEIQSLKTELIEVKQDKEVFKEKSEELEKFKDFIDENHKDIIEDFEDKRKNRYMRHR